MVSALISLWAKFPGLFLPYHFTLPAFNYAIPALFGGLVAQNVLKTKKSFLLYLIPLAICLFFCYFTKVAAAYYMLVTVFAGAAAYYFLDYKRGKKSEETK